MNGRKTPGIAPLMLLVAIVLPSSALYAIDITDSFSIGGTLGATYQRQNLSAPPGVEDTGRGAFAFQPEASFRPSEEAEIFVKLGFAAGNGLNDISPFLFSGWAADIEDDVKNINGRDRDYLLTAWYKHTLKLGDDHTLGITGGIIDATDYLDLNAYANDEFTQFMNAALVNAPNGFFPSYDLGGAFEWEMGNFSVTGVAMSIGENDAGNSYNFYGLQAGYALDTALGNGNYRVIVDSTSKDFDDPAGAGQESLKSLIVSFDQELGSILGAWIRLGWSDNAAIIDFKDLYSGGFNIGGKLWGRESDNIGIGCAYLRGGNRDVENSLIIESYARFALTEIIAVTADVQYVNDEFKVGDDSRGFIYGIRLTAAW